MPCSTCSNNIRSSSCRALPVRASLRSSLSFSLKLGGLRMGGRLGSHSREGERSHGEQRAGRRELTGVAVRRVAAISVAQRVAEEVGCILGEEVRVWGGPERLRS